MLAKRPVRIRFEVSLVVATLGVVLALYGVTVTGISVVSTRAAEDSARALFGEVAERVHDRVDRQMAETVNLAALGASLDLASTAADATSHPALTFLHRALASNPSLYSAYYGYTDGTMIQVLNIRDDKRLLDARKAPPGTWTIIGAYTGTGEDRRLTWTFEDRSGAILGTRIEPLPAYDPRSRPWYKLAEKGEGVHLSDPYLFSSLPEPGITASQRLGDGRGVFAVDLTLAGLDAFIERQTVSEHGGVIVLDAGSHLLAGSSRLWPEGRPPARLADVAATPLPALQAVTRARPGDGGALVSIPPAGGAGYAAAGEKAGPLMVQVAEWTGGGHGAIRIGVVAPFEDFTAHIDAMQRQVFIMIAALTVVIIPLVMFLARGMASTVRHLAADAARVRDLDFSGVVPEHSGIKEFHLLAQAFNLMKKALSAKTEALAVSQSKLERIIDLGIAMAAERDSARLMEMILVGAKELSYADGGTIYIRDEADQLQFQIVRNDTLDISLGGTGSLPAHIPPVPMFDAEGRPNAAHVVSRAVNEQTTVNIEDAYDTHQFDFSGTRAFDARNGYRSQSFLTVPLKPRGGDIIGALQLINARAADKTTVVGFSADIQRFVEALAGQAATALYNRDLLAAQEQLVDSMVRILADAIDAKSPYTGGHCARVPELATMLAHEAAAVTEGPLAEFAFTTEDEWREFHIGAWLHDCGKVTTPEYVVDKATKLETIYNRIHEVRTRFEVLLRDAEIERLSAIVAGEAADVADSRWEEQRQAIIDDFAFIAECNVGGEFMAPAKIERLRRIATRTWLRTLDDRIGLSQEELLRYANTPAAPVPAVEFVLADKPHHLVPRTGDQSLYHERGFKMAVPENLYNFGEVYNLSVSRGTLTEEERFKINEHIIQTILMLETLPFPKQLRRVPEYAGSHHETLVGTGYPRKLDKDQLSVPSRIMAIADIFEALSASDRPYKKAKTLSETIKVLSFFKKDGHIDPDLFDLLLTSGVYLQYGEKFLRPEQIDDVDIAAYVTPRPAAGADREREKAALA